MISPRGKYILCFGELLFRFSPEMKGEFLRNSQMPIYAGGAELNVAASLALWDLPVKYLTALPDNYLSGEIIDLLETKKIDTSSIILSGERIGAYYLPQGKDLKNNAVIYDRNYSSFSNLKPGSIDWDKVLTDVQLFHLSAINPALNENIAALCLEGLKAASAKGIYVSMDLNYRAKLWQYGKVPVDVMQPLIEYCDLVMGNIWAAEKLAGISLSKNFDAKSDNKEKYTAEATESAQNLMSQFPKCKIVFNTFRFDLGEGIKYFATGHDAKETAVSSTYLEKDIVDRIGSGDCFMAGLIYGHVHKLLLKETLEFSAAAAISKLKQKGDAGNASAGEIKSKMQHG